MDYQVCVTRFKEDISWLLPIKERVIIMNKGDDDISDEFRQVKLPNWGQEEYGYLHYIVKYYDNLPEIMVFLQGGMEPHLGTYPGKKFDNPIELVRFMVEETKQMGHTSNHSQHKFGFYSAHYKFKLAKTYSHMADSGYLLGEWFEKYVKKPFPVNPHWFQSCLFGIRREHILTRSKEYYQWLLDDYPMSENRAEVGHYYERSFYYVFNLDQK